MSAKHPIIAITGSSGAGTTTVQNTFESIFRREGLNAGVLEGDSFHRWNRLDCKELMDEDAAAGGHLSHFGPEANLWEELEATFKQYSETGTCKARKYLHNIEEAEVFGQEPGTFTEWADIPADTDLLFYEGLHGGVAYGDLDIGQYTDLLVGVVPVANLEWIQKINRDCRYRGYSAEAVTDVILRRMHDYMHYICPQFSRTHVNFQRVPIVDTSNPFIARDIPSPDESMLVIRFADPKGIDFPYLLSMLHDSFMSRSNTLVVPGGKMDLAMQLIFTPFIWRMAERRKKAMAR
jgi:phosphoribulokinase